ncbi:MAG: hypothetical protein AB1626_00235 [Candidatus Micrarchaeota archaeon]
MGELFILRQLSVNSLFWVGVAAVAFGLLAGDITFLLLFAALFLINYLLLSAVRAFAPGLFAQLPEYHEPAGRRAVKGARQNLGFRIYPLAYPKVMDEELNAFAPELIHVDIKTDEGLVFQGNFNRDAIRQFKEALAQVLLLKDIAPRPVPARQKKPRAKK